MQDPNLAVRPDFTSDEHLEARQQLVNDGLTDEQAARSLASLWTIANNAAKASWAEYLERREANRLRAEEEAQQRRQAHEDEEEAARREDRKKNKNKYAPVRRAEVPSDPVILPSPYATRKLKAGEFCKLFYFTNKGLSDASKSALSSEQEALVMLPSANGLHSWIPAGAIKDPKVAVTKDENLSWEEFNEAAPRMIIFMRTYDWPQDCIDMHVAFWSALQTHRWHHAADPLKQCVLLLYQAQQRRRWHLAAGSTNSWSLETINDYLLLEAKEDLFNEQRTQQTTLAIQQAAVAFIASNPDLLRPQPAAASRHQALPNQTPQTPLSHKRMHPSPKEDGGPNKKCASDATRIALLNAPPLYPGTKNTKPSQSVSAKPFGPRTANRFAQHGSGKKAVLCPSMTPNTSAPVVVRPSTEPRAVLECRKLLPLTPYNANAWESELASAGVFECFAKIPEGFRKGFLVDFPPINDVQTPPNKDSISEFCLEFNSVIEKEIQKGRLVGPFFESTLRSIIGPFQSSPLSIIPKPANPSKFRIIQNFSFPCTPNERFPNPLINSFINVEKVPTMWGKFSIIFELIASLPPGSEVATCDVAEAYRMVPLHHSQWPAAIVRISDDQFCIDTCAAFGATPSAGAYGHIVDAGTEIF